jgi:alanyl-tRNA synthetase
LTRRLYYDDAYRTEFQARVTGVEKLSDGRTAVVLDETCFYPTSGGQLHDTGELAGEAVVEVLDEGHRILHVVDGATLAIGSEVSGVVDPLRRAHHRQQHSGQHVLSRVLEDVHGWPTVSSRLGETMNTLEFDAPIPPVEVLADVEDRVNRILWEGRPVRVRYLDEAEAIGAGLRKKVDRPGPVRVIEVDGVDRCGCGGTHVQNTSEIGMVAITGTEKVRGGTRLHFLCGERATRWRREREQWLDATARALTTGQDRVLDTVQRLQRETRERKKRMEAMARELVAQRAGAWCAAAEPGEHGVRIVLRILSEDEVTAMPEAVARITSQPGLIAILVAEGAGRVQVVAARGEGVDVDCAELLSSVLARWGGRGGGRPDHARGGGEDLDAVALLAAFRERLVDETDSSR